MPASKTFKIVILQLAFILTVSLGFNRCSLFGGDTATTPNTVINQPLSPVAATDESDLNTEPKASGPVEKPCADQKVNIAYDLNKRAKYYFGSYWQTRSETDIYFAWYSLQESDLLLSAVGQCSDKKNKHYRAVENIHRINQDLAKNIRLNLRNPSYGSLTHIFWEKYRQTFPRDIQ